MNERNLNLTQFLFELLGKRKRRIHLVARWHSTGGGGKDYLYEFVDHLLHRQINFSMHNDYFCIFDDQSFPINYTWLTPREREFVAAAYEQRDEIFKIIRISPSGTFFFGQCRITGVLEIERRRE